MRSRGQLSASLAAHRFSAKATVASLVLAARSAREPSWSAVALTWRAHRAIAGAVFAMLKCKAPPVQSGSNSSSMRSSSACIAAIVFLSSRTSSQLGARQFAPLCGRALPLRVGVR